MATIQTRAPATRATGAPRSVLALILGVAAALLGFPMLLAGVGLGAAQLSATQDGYFTTRTVAVRGDGSAITLDVLKVGRAGAGGWWAQAGLATVRLSATSPDGEDVFIGIAPTSAVRTYLAGVPHDAVTSIRPDGLTLTPRNPTAERMISGMPPDQRFWVAAAHGRGGAELTWDVTPGSYTAVVLNSDATPGVAVQLGAGVRIPHLLWFATGLAIAGVLLLAGAAGLIVAGAGKPSPSAADTGQQPARTMDAAAGTGSTTGVSSSTVSWSAAADHEGVGAATGGSGTASGSLEAASERLAATAAERPGTASERPHEASGSRRAASGRSDMEHGSLSTSALTPVRLTGTKDANLSRWLWLVKWLLALPHLLILVILWAVLAVVTVIAFCAILVTGHYPRGMFDLAVGILRWTWRVQFYATNALGSDRYPPFTLGEADYPADLRITYPGRLSRGLLLVKSWLLAFPHLLIVAVLVGTWRWDIGGDAGGSIVVGGLIGALTLAAGIVLLVTGRYPPALFDLIVGLNRWVYRVSAYVLLMTDHYPPFRLDPGPTEPVEFDASGPDATAPGTGRPDAAAPDDLTPPPPVAQLGSGKRS